ncbi:MAG: endonuclease/exonuclease/phosphatase family protein [Sphingobacteriaceae bacterium]|nr:endonuclease/exonuclease/phosphatase family protein [Sphingobacteriaceae bacterium]
MVIGFWNIGNNTDIGDLLIEFVKENEIDILFLAETKFKKERNTKCPDVVLDFLTKSKILFSTPFVQLPDLDFRVKALTKISSSLFDLKKKEVKSSRWSAYHLEIPSLIRMNLFPVHFHSKNNWSHISQALECVNLSQDISKIESLTKCNNTLLIGDFNMNPFDFGMVSSNGLNAISSLEYVTDNPIGRKVDGSHYRFLYNPMWNFFGDQSKPMATYYYRSSGHVSHEYHILDQIILSGTMKQYLTSNCVQIVTKIGGINLAAIYDRPNEIYSDHFPIKIKLKI